MSKIKLPLEQLFKSSPSSIVSPLRLSIFKCIYCWQGHPLLFCVWMVHIKEITCNSQTHLFPWLLYSIEAEPANQRAGLWLTLIWFLSRAVVTTGDGLQASAPLCPRRPSFPESIWHVARPPGAVSACGLSASIAHTPCSLLPTSNLAVKSRICFTWTLIISRPSLPCPLSHRCSQGLGKKAKNKCS